MAYITLDTETCGLHGPIVLLQWAEGDGEIHLEDLWHKTPAEVIDILEMLVNHPDGILAFNAAFDWFHVYQMWTVLKLMPNQNKRLEDQVEEYAALEPEARDYPLCLKPHKCFDVFLHARKTEYQSTMDRKDIRIRRVPSVLAHALARELEKRVPLKDIYFARRKDKHEPKWQVFDTKDTFGEVDPNWKDIIVKFRPSSALKALAVDIGIAKSDEVIRFSDIEVPRHYWPEELGYAPYAQAIGKSGNWKGTWPEMIRHHIAHWAYYEPARKYGTNDITYTREIYKYFGSPAFDDVDSTLAYMVGVVRWRGFKIDIPGIEKLKQDTQEQRFKNGHKIPTAPNDVKRYIMDCLSEVERVVIQGSTKKVILEELARQIETYIDEDGSEKVKRTVAAYRAEEVLTARKIGKKIELYDKLLLAGRFHVSTKVIGALSGRMAGADKLNAQGIDKTKVVRSKFPLAQDGYILAGGDFDGFEVTIYEASCNELKLREALLTCEACKAQMIFDQTKRLFTCTMCGKTDQQTIHGLFGTFVFPPLDYDQIKATKGTEEDKYTRSKSGVFAIMFGGEGFTLESKLGVPIEIADKAVIEFGRRYPGVAKKRKEIHDMFGSMRQPGGIGTKVEWHEPADKIETMFGFARYYTLENKICKVLFDLAQRIPVAWKDMKIKVQRRDRLQTASGAVSSALYGAAFQIQSQNKRSAGNHVIQGSGAQITKKVQADIWKIQPSGVSTWLVQNMNVHDEIMCVTHPSVVDEVEKVVSDSVEEFRPAVPLICMKWKKKMGSWGEK